MSAKKLSRRLFELVLVSTIPVLICAGGALFLYHELEFEQQITRLRNHGQAISLAIDNDLRSWIGALEVLGSSPHLDTGRLKQFYDQAVRAREASKQWNNIILYDSTGYQLLNLRLSRNAPVDRLKSTSEAVEKSLFTGRPVVSDLFLGRLSKQPTVIAAVPAIRDGKIKYVMTCGVSPHFLTTVLTRQRLPQDWRVFVIDRAGHILASNDTQKNVSAQFAPLKPPNEAIASSRASDEPPTFEETDANGTKNVVAVHKSQLSGWVVKVSVPKNNLTNASVQALFLLFGGEIVLISGGIIFAVVFARRITRAITSLFHLAKAVGREELVHPLPSPVVEVNQVSEALGDASLALHESRKSLVETKERLRLAMEAGNIGTWRWDIPTGLVNCSKQCRNILGLTLENPITIESMRVIYDPDGQEGVWSSIYNAAQQKTDYEMEHRIVRPDGRVRHILVRGHVQYDIGGQPSSMNGVVIDDTERKEIAERLREKDRQYLDQYVELEALLTAMPLGVAYMDRDMRFIRVNEHLAEINGLPAAEHIGRSLKAVVPQLAGTLENIYRKLFLSGMPIPDVEISGITPAHPELTRHWLANFYPIRLSDGSVKGACAVILDITTRKEAEVKIHQASQRSKQLSQQLLHFQEESRRRLARELHDEFGQALTGLKLVLEGLMQNVQREHQAGLSPALSMVTELITMTRNLSLNLRPPVLDDFGLLAALSWYINQYVLNTRVNVNFQHEGLLERRFSHEIETAVFRIIQEALTNVARHAHVDSAFLSVVATPDTLKFELLDRGDGFDAPTVLRSHHGAGLSGMQERAEVVNGDLTIKSRPHEGTHIIGVIPLGQTLYISTEWENQPVTSPTT